MSMISWIKSKMARKKRSHFRRSIFCCLKNKDALTVIIQKGTTLNEVRDLYYGLCPFFKTSSDPSQAKDVTLKDGKIINEDEVFGEWSWVDDRFAAGGGFNIRKAYIKLDKSTPYSINYYDENEKIHELLLWGLVELIQFKSPVRSEACTLVGDLRSAEYRDSM